STQEKKSQGELFQKKRARKVESFECAVGARVQVMFGNRRTTGVITALHEKLPQDFPVPQNKIRPILRVLDETPLLNEETMSLGKWISSFYLCSIGEAYSAMIPGGIKESEAAWGFSAQIEEDDFSSEKILSCEQKNAVQGILNSAEIEIPCEEISSENKFDEKKSKQKNLFQYIYGATGSGKTEVFLSAAEKILEKGKGVIYLVPEIALTPQVARAVVNRFGSTVAILHSRLTPAQKLFEYKRIIKKEARVVIGARSAIFAPVPNLGMIIIDEEHDSSYKSENTPRYHARQVAMHRAQLKKIPLVMGSATPSVEAWNSIAQKKFECHCLTKRLSGGKMPLIECVDLSREKIEGSISKILEDEIRATLAENRQVILFLNRRGFNHIFRCQTCGFELKCKNCSVPMTYHKVQNKILCHYCGYSLKPLSVCPKCASLDIGYLGFGTEFIENEVKSKFPSARAIRLDTDSLGKKNELEEKIAAFKNGEADILLGTQ
ncbi:MAG: primosomal protein N', partial [Treponemataceae bacterium]|nr:primosomal protein N' [Treponemataceae bacterium]